MKLLTKSRFKLGLECPNKLFYTKKKEYANQKVEDSFLEALAQGGFQVEELARMHYPDGELLEQETSNSLSLYQNIIILCGHYKGIDERIREKYITKEISIGSYVLSGGELGAAVLVDSIVRLIPGVLNDETSALTDSFQDGLLSPPVYTRPASYNGWNVPDILTSGNTPKVEAWREEQALERTKKLRPDLLE